MKPVAQKIAAAIFLIAVFALIGLAMNATANEQGCTGNNLSDAGVNHSSIMGD